MNNLLNNDAVNIALTMFIVLYGLNLGKMKLPTYIKDLFNNTIFRIVFLSLLLVYRFNNSPHVALTVALLFVLGLDYLYTQQIKENFIYLESFRSQLQPLM
jgi:hypothetical protein